MCVFLSHGKGWFCRPSLAILVQTSPLYNRRLLPKCLFLIPRCLLAEIPHIHTKSLMGAHKKKSHGTRSGDPASHFIKRESALRWVIHVVLIEINKYVLFIEHNYVSKRWYRCINHMFRPLYWSSSGLYSTLVSNHTVFAMYIEGRNLVYNSLVV